MDSYHRQFGWFLGIWSISSSSIKGNIYIYEKPSLKQSTLRVVDAASWGYQSSSVMEHVEPSAGESWFMLSWPAACCVFPSQTIIFVGWAVALIAFFILPKCFVFHYRSRRGSIFHDLPRHSVRSLQWQTSWTLPLFFQVLFVARPWACLCLASTDLLLTCKVAKMAIF